MEPIDVPTPPGPVALLPPPDTATHEIRLTPESRSFPKSLMPTPRELLDRLETRHDELIRKLDELNVQIEDTLAHFIKARGGANAATSATSEAPIAVAATEGRPKRRAA